METYQLKGFPKQLLILKELYICDENTVIHTSSHVLDLNANTGS